MDSDRRHQRKMAQGKLRVSLYVSELVIVFVISLAVSLLTMYSFFLFLTQ